MTASTVTDGALYARSCVTMLASWAEYARACPGAVLHRLPGVAAGVFPPGSGFEGQFYNNALLDRDLTAAGRVEALDALEHAYRAAGVERFAAWVHESDPTMCHDLERRGYTVTESTLAMGMTLAAAPPPPPLPAGVTSGPVDWADYLAFDSLPADFLAAADHAAFHPLAVRDGDGVVLAVALAYDHGGDCGIFNVGTAPAARRRGLAAALTAAQVAAARERGCVTASLQSTPMAERVYAAVGFRDLGRFLEHTPLLAAGSD